MRTPFPFTVPGRRPAPPPPKPDPVRPRSATVVGLQARAERSRAAFGQHLRRALEAAGPGELPSYGLTQGLQGSVQVFPFRHPAQRAVEGLFRQDARLRLAFMEVVQAEAALRAQVEWEALEEAFSRDTSARLAAMEARPRASHAFWVEVARGGAVTSRWEDGFRVP